MQCWKIFLVVLTVTSSISMQQNVQFRDQTPEPEAYWSWFQPLDAFLGLRMYLLGLRMYLWAKWYHFVQNNIIIECILFGAICEQPVDDIILAPLLAIAWCLENITWCLDNIIGTKMILFCSKKQLLMDVIAVTGYCILPKMILVAVCHPSRARWQPVVTNYFLGKRFKHLLVERFECRGEFQRLLSIDSTWLWLCDPQRAAERHSKR